MCVKYITFCTALLDHLGQTNFINNRWVIDALLSTVIRVCIRSIIMDFSTSAFFKTAIQGYWICSEVKGSLSMREEMRLCLLSIYHMYMPTCCLDSLSLLHG